ncbi:hypothetical protein D3C87_2105450 [compost metagenome]
MTYTDTPILLIMESVEKMNSYAFKVKVFGIRNTARWVISASDAKEPAMIMINGRMARIPAAPRKR